MNLNFLPNELQCAIQYLNLNYLSEIRIRKGQPVIIEYFGEYVYINKYGKSKYSSDAIKVYDVESILTNAMQGSVYAYSEQLKNAFITLDGGIRIGIGGEYVTDKGLITAVRCVTSLNIRLPHNVVNCSENICEILKLRGLHSTLLYSKPGMGKTTMLRDMVIHYSKFYNILLFDERSEIAAMDADGIGFDLGERCDVIRGNDKFIAFNNAIRAMKPQIIVTDELYGESDFKAVRYAVDCGIVVFASTHMTDRQQLKSLPFDYYAELTGIGETPIIYDKNFVNISDNSSDDGRRISAYGL